MVNAFYDTYHSCEPVDEFLRDVNVRDSVPVLRESLSAAGSEPNKAQTWAFFCEYARAEAAEGFAYITSVSKYPQTELLPTQKHRSVIHCGLPRLG